MPRRNVLIEISRGRVEVAMCRSGGICTSRSERIQPVSPDEWSKSLPGLAPTLRALIEGLDVTGADATILYWSPTAVAGVFSCAQNAGAAAALSAARLALAETADFDLASSPSAVLRIATDRSGDASSPARVHTLGAADTEASTQAIMDLVQQCGLTPVALIPVEAPVTSLCAAEALEAARTGAAVWLFVGEHSSILAGAASGRLKFLRQIAIGAESLVAALTREIAAAPGNAAVSLDESAARELLFSAGIPLPQQVFDSARNIAGSAVLPLLQPVLQRWMVEIKQSLRFGFDEAERASAALHVTGPGASIPRLITIFAEQCGLRPAAAAPQPPAGAVPGSSSDRGPIAAWRGYPCRSVNLLPRAASGRRRHVSLSRGLWVGVGASLAIISADALLVRMALTGRRAETRALESRLAAALPAAQLRDRLIAAESGLAAARARLARRMSPVVNWDALLVALSLQMPSDVRITDIKLTIENGEALCRLSAETPLNAASARIKNCLDSLAAVPLVSSCRLGATHRGETVSGGVQQFEIVLGLVSLPVGVGYPVLASHAQGKGGVGDE